MKRKFTLIEFIVVIAIIVMLVALLMPAAIKVRNNAKKAKAKAEMSAIITAITSYEATYGVLPQLTTTNPWWTNNSQDYTSGSPTRYDIVMQLLTGVPKGGATLAYRNVRNIRFLDIPSTYTSTDNTVNGYRDPWFNYYNILVDTDYDGQIKWVDGSWLYGSAFVYSTAGTSNNSDTVYSWRTTK